MADADHQHDDQQDVERVSDLEVPEDEARSVEGGLTSNPVRTQEAVIKGTIANTRP